MQHSTDFGCSANLASALRPAVSPRPAGDSRCAPRTPYLHDPAGMPPPVCWCLPAADRICHAVTFSLEEDLSFLKDHIDEEDLVYNSYVQGLLTTGLMYQSVIDGNDESKYSFTPLAGLVDQYAVSYENLERYPNPMQITDGQTILRQQISPKALTNDEMDDILRKI